jgi:predicted ArsR family transcriptional regulator
VLDSSIESALDDLARLSDPVRRRLYLLVIGRPEPVSRDEAAAAVGITRALAAFHLDRLVEAGLLKAEYRRLGGRRGPGAGRPSKLYRQSDRVVRATLPERRFEVAAEIFADALAAPRESVDALDAAAERHGLELGRAARARVGENASSRDVLAALQFILHDAGYVPFERDGEIRLLNCPFHEIAQKHRELTCGMNLALLRGLLTGAGMGGLSARLEPATGMCCVAIGHSEAERNANATA